MTLEVHQTVGEAIVSTLRSMRKEAEAADEEATEIEANVARSTALAAAYRNRAEVLRRAADSIEQSVNELGPT